jgi:hypothetical protein
LAAARGPEIDFRRFEFTDPDEFAEMAFDRGWTDGFPVFVPTEKRVLGILDYIKRPANESLGQLEPGKGDVTMEAIAVNCAMAGCLKEYVPIVIAAVEAMLDPDFDILGSVSPVGGPPLAIISGPVVKKLKFNYDEGANAASGHRSNSTIARAIRLIQWNLGRSRPGDLARPVFAQADRWGHIICDRPQEDGNPWEPFQTSVAGLGPQESAVSMLDAHGTYIGFGAARTGSRNIERNLIDLGRRVALLRNGANSVLVLNPQITSILYESGWTKERVRQVVWENSYHTAREYRERRYELDIPGEYDPNAADDEKLYHLREPAQLQIMVSGGWGNAGTNYLYTGGNNARRYGHGLVTRKIDWNWD